ncbi:sensor histidine kinase [Geodermatophilus sabuli]|uniref:Anti-sigma regulatory factor (Ser/Thr protein kinase) n=1 Tax=Geodermatophilus sabuli TaxID=1564158 RepID=A0A285EE97_9ACTN|nr:sensor histidine kinase [Geodermatophilus sabuli]MBB3084204.1 anti-sigma regulatory factor (Ser/Thr protein kinase) [Geodermatophilus sabuli]SNX96524.1 Anti-sigma regulatory factor (Ser/Thr protein kinase) [Geodermatophilus sabuli]
MTPITGTGPDLLHAALLYDSTEELAASAVPFLAAGLAAGDAAVLACREGENALLVRALDGDDRVLVLPREEIYVGSAQALATYRRMVHRQVAAGASRIRLVCAVVPVDRRPWQWDEWHRYEAVFNAVMDRMPLSSVCAYDRRQLSAGMRDGIEETHPALLTPGGPVPNDRYVEPASVLRRTSTVSADRAEDSPPTLVLAGLTDPARLPELRGRLRAALNGADGHGQLQARFAAAVTEVLGNAFRHGAPPIAVRLWTTPMRLAATVTDCGQGFDDPLAGFLAPGTGSPPAGAGLWAARQGCDTLETFRTRAEFTVRLTTGLPRPQTASALTAPPAAEAGTAPVDRARAAARELARRLQT